MKPNKWAAYVDRVRGDHNQAQVAAHAGVDQATVSRWLRGGAIGRGSRVANFARAYDANVLEALVAAGYITEEEARRGLDEEHGRSP
jgi:DNA-binding LacI/PurR family transcriptional regulator